MSAHPGPWAVIALAVALIGIAKSGFGGGLGLIVVPIVTIALPRAGTPGQYRGDDALGLLLPLLIVGDVIAVWQYRREVSWPTVGRLMPGAVAGVLLGTVLIWLLKRHAAVAASLINLEIGFESVFLVGLTWYRQWHGRPQRLLPEPWRALGSGAFAGTSSTLAHAAGPIVAMYLLPLGLGRLRMVATSATFFFCTNSAKLPTYWQAGLFERVSVPFALLFFPLVLGGAVFGRWLTERMSDKVFIQVVYGHGFRAGRVPVFEGAERSTVKSEKLMKNQVAIVTGGSRGNRPGDRRRPRPRRVRRGGQLQRVRRCRRRSEGRDRSRRGPRARRAGRRVEGRRPPEARRRNGARVRPHRPARHNAGVAPDVRADVLEATEASFDRLISINLKGPYFLTQLVANRMISQTPGPNPQSLLPKIINITSISAYTAHTNRGDYAISKAGLAMMTQVYAARLAEHGINVYEIRPGVIATDMTGAVKEKYDDLIFNKDMTPIKRWAGPTTSAAPCWRSRTTRSRSAPARSSTSTAASICGGCEPQGVRVLRVPTYWSREDFAAVARDGRAVTRSAWGWSFESPADAKAVAADRARRAVQRASSGTAASYEYGEIPLREPACDEVAVGGNVVGLVTRNRYGCRVLNTERVMFADLDFPPRPAFAVGGWLARWFKTDRPPTHEQATLARVAAWQQERPATSLRVYRTFAGLRLLFTDGPHDPKSPHTRDVLRSLGSDLLYYTLTQRQGCFRARLSPKPWRCGVPPFSPRSAIEHPGEPGRLAAWAEAYEARSAAYTTCRLVRVIGRAPQNEEIDAVVAWHDRCTIDPAGVKSLA